MKLSKERTKLHEQAVAHLKSGNMSWYDREFVMQHWSPLANHNVGVSGTFFTPLGMARNAMVELDVKPGQRIVDLCAGIGRLAYTIKEYTAQGHEVEVVCVEQNPEFVEVGKLAVPDATWVCGDILDKNLWDRLGTFDSAISNPPFGNIKTGADHAWTGLGPSGWTFEFKAGAVAAKVAEFGVFLVPDQVAGFKFSDYSKNRYRAGYQDIRGARHKRFRELTGYEWTPNCGIDLSAFEDSWEGTVAPCVELAVLMEAEE